MVERYKNLVHLVKEMNFNMWKSRIKEGNKNETVIVKTEACCSPQDGEESFSDIKTQYLNLWKYKFI